MKEVRKTAFTATGWTAKEMTIAKDEDGNYYIECDDTLYKLALPPNCLEKVQYDDENPITDYEIKGFYNLLTGALLPPSE